MYQGTTPEFSFTLPFNLDQVKSFLITFKQNSKVLNFTQDEVRVDGNKIYIKLTQEQTNLFLPDFKCRVQIRCKLLNDSVIASQIESVNVKLSLNSEVL